MFADVQPREGVTCVILIGNIFLILMAFYLIKPVREGWLAVTDIGSLTKVEIKAYSAFAQSLLLFGILPVYARMAAQWQRRVLITRVGGAFGVALVAQFWAFTADVYGADRGSRLFPIVAIGAALGATLGSWLGQVLVRLPAIEAFDLILVALVPLGLALWLAV